MGVPSIIYSFIMGFLVLRRVKRQCLVISISACLSPCFILPSLVTLFLLIIEGMFSSIKRSDLFFLLFSFLSGAIVGFILYGMHQQQLNTKAD